MMDLFLNNLDLIIGGVIGMLFFMLGFFMSTIRAEKRHYKLRERQMREEIIAAKKTGSRSSEDAVELGRLRAEVTGQLEALKQKDLEIKKLIEQLSRATEDHRRLEEQISEASSEKGEGERLRAELNTRSEEMAAKEQELNQLREERRGIEDRIARADKILADFGHFEDNVHEQMKHFDAVEQRIREIEIKLRVLTEKSKEGVELIAGFAAGKEFDEFRKSIHLDELKQKDEDKSGDINSVNP